jgi:DNA-binding XRE family transcriptional regulator
VPVAALWFSKILLHLLPTSIFYVDTGATGLRQQKMLEMLPAQCRAARALIGMTQPALAEAAGLGLSSIVDFEKARRIVSPAGVAAMRAALEAAGVDFIPENGGGPGVRLRKGDTDG